MSKKLRWLDRRIAAPGPHLCLCLSEAEYKAAMRHVGAQPVNEWVTPGANGTAHIIDGPSYFGTIVCLDGWQGRDPIEVAGLIVHEAVHIWQMYAERIGEKSPGLEQEAYAVQSIAQELMAEFARRVKEQQ